MMFIIGTGSSVGLDAAQVAIERRALRRGCRARSGHGDGEDGVGAQPALVGRAVERDHDAIDLALLGGVLAVQRRRRSRR